TKFINKLDANPTKIMEDYSRNCGWLSGEPVSSYWKVDSSWARMAELFDVLDNVNNGRCEHTIVNKDANEANVSKVVLQNDLDEKLVVHDSIIIFEKVLIVTSSQDVLVKELSFKQLSESDQDLLQNFHIKINKLANKLYTICKEYFPSIELIGVRKECYCCYYNTKDIIKKFLEKNNMNPGNVLEELQGLTKIEEMLIAQIFPVLSS
ncbi:81_t:CDS:2, partial [Dentiscutata erythropus]